MHKRCAVTGHRDIPIEIIGYVTNRLREEVSLAISEGYTVFSSGMANGADIIFAEIVIEFKKNSPKIKLEAFIPYREHLNSKEIAFKRAMQHCDNVYVVQEEYSVGCYMFRNKRLVRNSDLLIAVYSGKEKSGTGATLRYAGELNRAVRLIEIPH